MKGHRVLRKLLAAALSAALVLGAFPITLLAESGCGHRHDENCGYSEEAPCGHVHDEDCGGLPQPEPDGENEPAEPTEPADPALPEPPEVPAEADPEGTAPAPASEEGDPAEDDIVGTQDSNDITADFTDANFRAAVRTAFNKGPSDPILKSEVSIRTQLDVSAKGIANLAGIEHFENLDFLDCSGNQLTALDLRDNLGLATLNCSGNQLTALDLRAHTGLTSLNCSGNRLTALDLSAHSALTLLDCSGNRLTALDLSANTGLTSLNCWGNQLTALDLGANTRLTSLNCSGNRLTTLGVNFLQFLQELECGNNQLTTLDAGGLTALLRLGCSVNPMTTLNVQGCAALEGLLCWKNQLTTLDVRGLENLQMLDCALNQLTTLDVRGLRSLQTLECYSNQLTALDVSGLAALTTLYCQNNNMTSKAAVTGFAGTWDEVNFVFLPQRVPQTPVEGPEEPAAQPIAVRAITLNMAAKVLKPKETVALKATVAPEGAADRAVTWTSSKPKVASVDQSGKVKGLKAGSAVITAKTANGKTAKVKITVAKTAKAAKEQAVKGVKITAGAKTLALKPKDAKKTPKTVTLKAVVAPAGAKNKKVAWSSSDPKVATVSSSGKVTAKKVGKAKITCRTQEGGKVASVTITVKAK